MSATTNMSAYAVRMECNRRRRDDLVVRGATDRYIVRLKNAGCIWDDWENVWLAPDQAALDQIGQWPGVAIGTEGPRLHGESWPVWCRGWAVYDLPISYARRWVATLTPDDGELFSAMTHRADGGTAKGRRAASTHQSRLDEAKKAETRRLLEEVREWRAAQAAERAAHPCQEEATIAPEVAPQRAAEQEIRRVQDEAQAQAAAQAHFLKCEAAAAEYRKQVPTAAQLAAVQSYRGEAEITKREGISCPQSPTPTPRSPSPNSSPISRKTATTGTAGITPPGAPPVIALLPRFPMRV